MKKKKKDKPKPKGKKVKKYKLNFYTRQWGMLERYTPLTINLIKYYLKELKSLYYGSPARAKVYIEDSAGYTKEQIIPLLVGMPHNIKFVWGRRKYK